MEMKKPRICAIIVSNGIEAIREVEPFVELFEVRIDLIGDGWQEVARQLSKPWIACNRIAREGGSWEGNEAGRVEELVKASEMGADIIDIELSSANLKETVEITRKRARCLLSFHDLEGTPPPDEMREVVQRQLEAGADICKLVTTAQKPEDNMIVLQLIADFPEAKVVSFAMGPLGLASRILCPLVGSYFTYASVEAGKESAPGQITVRDLRKIYGMVAD